MKKLLITILSLLALIGLVIFLISPTKQLDESIEEKSTLVSILAAKDPTAFSASFSENGLSINYEFTEEEWNQYLSYYIKNVISDVEAVNVEFEDERIQLYLNKKGLFTMQYKVGLIPKVEDEKLKLEVKETKLGRLPLPKSLLLGNIEADPSSAIQIDKNKDLVLQFPEAINFDSVDVSYGHLNTAISIQISSFFDLMNLIDVLLPEDFIENLIN